MINRFLYKKCFVEPPVLKWEVVYTWNWTRPGMKSSLSMVKYLLLLLFTPFCQHEISSRDELIHVKKTGMKFYPVMKKEKKTSKRFTPGWSFKMIVFFFNFWCMNSNIMGTAFFPLGGQRDHTRKKMYIFDYEQLRHWRDCNWTRKQNHLIVTQRLNHLAKLSGRLAILSDQVFEYSFRWFWVRVQLQSLHLQISRVLRARSSLTFRQL